MLQIRQLCKVLKGVIHILVRGISIYFHISDKCLKCIQFGGKVKEMCDDDISEAKSKYLIFYW